MISLILGFIFLALAYGSLYSSASENTTAYWFTFAVANIVIGFCIILWTQDSIEDVIQDYESGLIECATVGNEFVCKEVL